MYKTFDDDDDKDRQHGAEGDQQFFRPAAHGADDGEKDDEHPEREIQ